MNKKNFMIELQLFAKLDHSDEKNIWYVSHINPSVTFYIDRETDYISVANKGLVVPILYKQIHSIRVEKNETHIFRKDGVLFSIYRRGGYSE